MVTWVIAPEWKTVIVSSTKAVSLALDKYNRAGFLGRRVWVEQGKPSRIHLADNVADVVVALNEADAINQIELACLKCKG